jgi:hypothetical protein
MKEDVSVKKMVVIFILFVSAVAFGTLLSIVNGIVENPTQTVNDGENAIILLIIGFPIILVSTVFMIGYVDINFK